VAEPLESPAAGPFLLQDRDKSGAKVDGTVSGSAAGAGTAGAVLRDRTLRHRDDPPVDLYGNVIHVVWRDGCLPKCSAAAAASVAFPSFKLKKKPLTYTSDGAAPTADAARSQSG
jgi:hypothetical protein